MLPARLLAELLVVEGYAASPRQLRERVGITGVDPNTLGETKTIATIAAILENDPTTRVVAHDLLFPKSKDVSSLASSTGVTQMQILNSKSRAGRDQIAEEIDAEPAAPLIDKMIRVAREFNAIHEEQLWEKVVNTVNKTCTSGAARSILSDVASCVAKIRERDALGHQYCSMVGMHRRLEGERFRRHTDTYLEMDAAVAEQLAPLVEAAGADDDTELRVAVAKIKNKSQFLVDVLGYDPDKLPRIAGHEEIIVSEIARLYGEVEQSRDLIALKYVR